MKRRGMAGILQWPPLHNIVESVRMGRSITSYHRDGVKLTERSGGRLMSEDRAAQAAPNSSDGQTK